MSDRAVSDRARLHPPVGHRPLEVVLAVPDGEVGEQDVPRIARSNRRRTLDMLVRPSFPILAGRLTVELSRRLMRPYVEDEVAAVIAFLPLHLVIAPDCCSRTVARGRLYRAIQARGRDGRARKLDAHGPSSRLLVVGFCAQPGDIGDLPFDLAQSVDRDGMRPTQF